MAIISDGPYRFSPNPGYLSMALLYAGSGIETESVWIIGLLLPTLAVMRYGVIAREERQSSVKNTRALSGPYGVGFRPVRYFRILENSSRGIIIPYN